jgi:hypothetical protein
MTTVPAAAKEARQKEADQSCRRLGEAEELTNRRQMGRSIYQGHQGMRNLDSGSSAPRVRVGKRQIENTRDGDLGHRVVKMNIYDMEKVARYQCRPVRTQNSVATQCSDNVNNHHERPPPHPYTTSLSHSVTVSSNRVGAAQARVIVGFLF